MNDEIENLIKEVRQVAYELHVYLGIGLLEKVYENGLRHRLEMSGHKVETQKPLAVFDADGFVLGEYFADLVVDDSLVIELKSVKGIAFRIFYYLWFSAVSLSWAHVCSGGPPRPPHHPP